MRALLLALLVVALCLGCEDLELPVSGSEPAPAQRSEPTPINASAPEPESAQQEAQPASSGQALASHTLEIPLPDEHERLLNATSTSPLGSNHRLALLYRIKSLLLHTVECAPYGEGVFEEWRFTACLLLEAIAERDGFKEYKERFPDAEHVEREVPIKDIITTLLIIKRELDAEIGPRSGKPAIKQFWPAELHIIKTTTRPDGFIMTEAVTDGSSWGIFENEVLEIRPDECSFDYERGEGRFSFHITSIRHDTWDSGLLIVPHKDICAELGR